MLQIDSRNTECNLTFHGCDVYDVRLDNVVKQIQELRKLFQIRQSGSLVNPSKMSNAERDSFCKKMRKATREIHAVSDALVNAKLAFGKCYDLIK